MNSKQCRLTVFYLLALMPLCRIEPISAAISSKITVLPDTIVEVGEEVYFDAMQTSGVANIQTVRYEWIFGDGYSCKFGEPLSSTMDGGIACIHYYMKPGVFTATLYASEVTTDITQIIRTCTTTVHITVNGETPMQGFEIWSAPHHDRIRQFLYIQIPASIVQTQTNRLRVGIKGSNGAVDKVLLEKTGLSSSEKVLLDFVSLPGGTYSLTAELSDASQNRLSIVKDKFSKDYTGLPHVAINENNAICIDGKPFFPVTPFMLDNPHLPEWSSKKYINSLYAPGFYDKHDISTWTDYLSNEQKFNLASIGPVRWAGAGPINATDPSVTQNWTRNHDVDKMAGYVSSTKNNPGLLMWQWADEPNIGGRNETVAPQVMAAWTYRTHRTDNQHPVATNLYGFDYLPYYSGNDGTRYDYANSAAVFGGKKAALYDITGFDIYPMDALNHVSLKDPKKGLFELYIQAIDNLVKTNYNLIPAFSFVEVCDIDPSTNTVGPSSSQVLMEAWMNVVHGIKGINWFHYFVVNSIRFDAMATFCRQMTQYGGIVLGPETNYTITNDANVRGKRVDYIVRENAGDIYIFAVRITEPEPEWQEVSEPESITAGFNLNSINCSGKSVFELEQGRTISINNSQFSDVFTRDAVHIYKIAQQTTITNNTVSVLFDAVQIKRNGLHQKIILHYALKRSGDVSISCFTMRGQLSQTIVRGFQNQGVYEYSLNPGLFSGGTMLIRLKSDTETYIKKLILVR